MLLALAWAALQGEFSLWTLGTGFLLGYLILVALVRGLPPKGRALWNRAQRRDFNVGIQAASQPYSYELPLEVSTVRAAAAVNARIVFTIYGNDSKGSQPTTKKRQPR